MATLKGITLEIGGNTTNLQQSLKQVDAEAKRSQNAIKEIDRALKFDPKSTELLTMRQEELGNQIKATSDRLEMLKQADRTAKDQLNRGEISTEEYAKLQSEIGRTEQTLGKLQTEADTTKQKLRSMGEAAQKQGAAMQETGKKLTLGLTTPIMGIGAAAMAAWSEYDDAIDAIALSSGAGGDALAELEDTYRKVFGSLPVESEKVANAVGELNTQFGWTGTKLDEAVEGMVKYSEITGQDVIGATQGAKGIIEAYGLEYEDLYLVLDQVAVASQNTGADTGFLMDQMVKAAPQINELGLTTGEAAFLMGELGQHGLDASNILGGLTRAQLDGAKSGKDLNTVMDEFTDLVASGAEEADILNEAARLFGTRRAPVMVDAAQRGALDFGHLADAAAEAGGTVNNTFEDILDPVDRAKVAMNNFKLAGADLGTAIQIGAAPALDWLADKSKSVADAFRNLDDEQQQFVVTLGAGLAAVGPATVAGGKLATMFGNMAERAGNAESGTGKLSAALGGGGKMALIGIAVAAGIAIYQYARNVDNLSNNLRKSREAVEDVIDTYEKSTNSVEVNAGMAQNLVGQIQDLQKAEELSNEEKIRMRTLIGQLNGLYPDLGLEIDEVTGKVEGLEESIDDMVQRMIDQQRIAANETVMTELANEAAGMYGKMTEAEETWINAKAQAQAEDSRLTDEYLDLLHKRLGVGGELTEQENERLDRYIIEQGLNASHQQDLIGLLDTYVMYSDEYGSIQGQIADIATDTQDIVTEANEKQGDSVDDLAERISGATEGTKASWKAYQEEHAGTLSEMRDNYEWYIDEYGNLQKEDTSNLERTQEEQRIIQENAKKREEDLQNEILANEEKWLDLRRTARDTNLSNQEKYQSDLETELGNQLGILSAFAEDEFKSLEASADQHFKHNEKKLKAYQNYTTNMEDLRGRVSDEMYAELEKMGPEHAGLIAEYAGMTEKELSKHSDQWVDIYEIMGTKAETEVAKIPEVTAEELGKLEGIIRDEEGNIYNAATDALGYITEAIRQEAPESEGQMDALVERVREKAETDLSELGKGAISTYSDAMEDWRPEAEEQAIALALAVFENSDGSLEERGKEAVQTYVDAMAEAEIDAINQAMRMARAVEGGAETSLFDPAAEGMHGYLDGQDSKVADLERQTQEIADSVKDILTQDHNPEGIHGTETYGDGIVKGTPKVLSQAEFLARTAKSRSKVTWNPEGEHGPITHAQGIRNMTPTVERASRDMANKAKAAAKVSTAAEGINFGASFASGIKSQRWAVQNEAASLGSAARNSLRSYMQIASPSRVMMELGAFTGEGFAVGIKDMTKDVEAAAKDLAAPLLAMDTQSFDFGSKVMLPELQQTVQTRIVGGLEGIINSQEIAGAIVQSMQGMGLYVDNRQLGEVTATGYQVATYARGG